MDYNFQEIEKKWQAKWAQDKTFAANIDTSKPKYYALDMFPYPSGAGLHVGHPLGYIASDIIARYKRLKGFNVLHPMGYDSFGLPAEQYAIQTGQHPAITTKENIARYRQQLDRLGFSFDWDREIRTSNPDYFKWTQWIFLQLFDSWYNNDENKAEPISKLVNTFESKGNQGLNAVCDADTPSFTAEEWKAFDEKKQANILLNYRIAYLSESVVNWCPALGTVLANDEVKDGLSERGGHPVEQRKMWQWSMRITAYAQRLLDDLNGLDWTDALKEIQRNWIGRSEGASVHFQLTDSEHSIEVFTTRPDTIFGVSFMVLAPDHELVNVITTSDQKAAVEAYQEQTAKKSERERMADTKVVSGAFTGAYATHPFTGEQIPVWIGDYVLSGYGTGAIMAVPSGDQRDWNFANHFNLPIINVVAGHDPSNGAQEGKEGTLCNSQFLDGLPVKEAISKAIEAIEEKEIGTSKINYKLRDAVFGRQRYWGEPIPVYYVDGIPHPVKEAHLPLELPEVDKYLPTEDGEPPLARASKWNYDPEKGVVANGEGYPLETTTMPGWAGSSWYYLRYEDPKNENEFAGKEAIDYWKQVDLYMGGAEHATGHLLYVRFWTKFLQDRGYLSFGEPAQKLINQGMIQGNTPKAAKVSDGSTEFIVPGKAFAINFGGRTPQIFISDDLKGEFELKTKPVTFPLYIVKGSSNVLDLTILKTQPTSSQYHENAYFFTNSGFWHKGEFTSYYNLHENPSKDHYISTEVTDQALEKIKDQQSDIDFTVSFEVEKMSKSKYNVVNPDILCESHGADALRLHEMFLGPVELHKPWNTKGIDGVSKFLRKLWKLYTNAEGQFDISDAEPNKEELKALHKCIQKVEDEMERFVFNTSVSHFMICVNELTDLKCNKRAILEPLAILVSCHAPHIAEELWNQLGHENSISEAEFPIFEEKYLKESSFSYPISFNGKMRFKLDLPADLSKEEIEKEVLSNEQTTKWLDGKPIKKMIVVPKRIVNIVI